MSPETRTLLNDLIEKCLSRAKLVKEEAEKCDRFFESRYGQDRPSYIAQRDAYLTQAANCLRAAEEILEMMQRDDESVTIIAPFKSSEPNSELGEALRAAKLGK